MATLLNTKWHFKESLIGIPADIEMNLTFISDGVSYKKIKWVASPGLVYTREDDVEKTVYAISGTTGIWETENYRTIEITGGADVEDETVQSALSALAVQIEDEPSTPSITDLTGYTVTVPAGWTATSGYGRFDIQGEVLVFGTSYPEGYSREFYAFNIGYSYDIDETEIIPSENSIDFGEWSPKTTYFTLSNISGADVTNTSLIQWLVDNNATFTKNETEETKYYISGTWKFKSKTVNGVVGPAVEVSETVGQELSFTTIFPNDHYDVFEGYTIRFEDSLYFDFDFISIGTTVISDGEKGWLDAYDGLSFEHCLFDFGTQQEVSKEFYDIMHTYADEVNYSDYYTKVTGKWKWNDTITPTEKGITISYYGFAANNKLWSDNVNVDWAGDYFGIADVKTGIGFYLAGVGWLDGSVTLNQLLAGTQPVPGTQLQTWDFGTEGVYLHNETQYKYLTENATQVTDTPSANTIKAGTYRFKDVLDSPSTDGTSANMKYTVLWGDELHNGYFISAGGDSVVYSTDKADLFVYNYSSATWATNYGDKIKIITVTEDTEVSENFYTWFNANTVPQKLMPAGVYRMKLSMIEIDISQYPETDVIIDGYDGNVYVLKLKTQKTFETYKNCETAVNNMLRFWTSIPSPYPGLDAEYNDVYNQGLAEPGNNSGNSWWGYHSDIINFTEEQYVDYILYDLIQEHAEPTTIRTLNGKYKFKDKLPLFNSSDVETIMLDNVTINNVNYGAAGFLNELITSNFGFTGVAAYAQQSANDENTTILYIDDYGWLDGKLTLGGLGTTPITPSDVTQTWEFNNTKVFYDFDYNYIMNNLYVDPDDPDTPDTPKPKFKIINPLVIFTSATKVVGTDLIVDAEEVEVVEEVKGYTVELTADYLLSEVISINGKEWEYIYDLVSSSNGVVTLTNVVTLQFGYQNGNFDVYDRTSGTSVHLPEYDKGEGVIPRVQTDVITLTGDMVIYFSGSD